MIEVVCPSCGACYQVPDESIGPEGRRVTCSNCSHKWRAHREAAPAAAVGGAESPAEAATAETAHTAEAEAEPEPETGEQPPAGSREAQMDAIRRMLDDLKRGSEDEPEAEPAEESIGPRSKRSDATMRRREEEAPVVEDLDESGDPLRSRISRMGGETSTGKEPARSNYDAAKLRRMHEKRAKRLQKAKERKRKSGAFVTGFTLVAAVAAVMVSLYMLRPQIVTASPEMAPAMNQYVATVDRYRIALAEATAPWREWVAETVGPLVEGEGGQAAGGSEGTQPAEQGQQ